MAYGFLLLDAVTVVRPDKMLSNATELNTLVARFGDGYEQRSPKGINSIKNTFNVSFINREASEIQDIIDLFNNKKGSTSFDFTYPTDIGETTIKVVCEKYNTSYVTDSVYSCSATFRQVYEL